jgi:hypothetical protein
MTAPAPAEESGLRDLREIPLGEIDPAQLGDAIGRILPSGEEGAPFAPPVLVASFQSAI